jgi:hypothetical protein
MVRPLSGTLGVLTLAMVALAAAPGSVARAQAPCERQCDASQRDANGCCPASPAPAHPPSAGPAAPSGGKFGDKCALSRECGGQLVCIDYRCQPPPSGAPAPAPTAPSAPSAPGAFNRDAAKSAVDAIAAGVSSCQQAGGPTGEGHVSITFATNGTVLTALVDLPPFAGTTVGGCVAGRFRNARVPPFVGGTVSIGRSFSMTAFVPSAATPYWWVGIAWNHTGGWASRTGATAVDAQAAALASCNQTVGSCYNLPDAIHGDRYQCFAIYRGGGTALHEGSAGDLESAKGAALRACQGGAGDQATCVLQIAACNDRR